MKSGNRLAPAGIIALMALGSVSIWILNPLAWMYLTGHLLAGSTQPSMGPYGLLLVGIIGTSVMIAKGLSALNRLYGRVTGSSPTVRIMVPWRRSLRGGRSLKKETDGRAPVGILEVVMVVSVLAAVVAFTAWMLVVNPTPPNIGGPGPAKG